MSEYLTLVFDASELAYDERLALCHRAASMSWTHALDERDELDAKLARADERAKRQRHLEAQLQGEINDLEEERDSLQRLADNRAEQRDALMVRQVRLIEAGNALAAELAFWQGSDHAPRTQAARDNWTFAVEEAPAESLARLKAHWQADVLEELAPHTAQPQMLESRAKRIRRQAEGDA